MLYDSIKLNVRKSKIIPEEIKEKILQLEYMTYNLTSILEKIFELEKNSSQMNKDLKWKSLQILVDYIRMLEEKSTDYIEIEKELDRQIKNYV